MKKLIPITIICSIFLIGCCHNCGPMKRAVYMATHNSTYNGGFCGYGSNIEEIKRDIVQMEGPIETVGWKAKKYNNQTYVIVYIIKNNGKEIIYPFDVNIKEKIVRYIEPKNYKYYQVTKISESMGWISIEAIYNFNL